LSESQRFAAVLMQWDRGTNRRSMPWKGIKDPYKIWLSEIILQQTRVEQGEPYYLRLSSRYPNVQSLAAADDQEVYRIWQGLGYYNRCRNMLHTARELCETQGGKFPQTYEGIRALRGIGDYTAAAIASFAFGLPHAVVDGNVVRVLSRVFGIKDSFQQAAGRKQFMALAQELLDKKQAGAYNQAMMDFGATVCKPSQPDCMACPFQKRCVAYTEQAIEDYPAKKIKKEVKTRHFHFWLPNHKRSVFLQQRSGRDIWHNLYTPLCTETKGAKLPRTLSDSFRQVPECIFTTHQLLSHQKIVGHFYRLPAQDLKALVNPETIRVTPKDLKHYPFPRLIVAFFENNDYL